MNIRCIRIKNYFTSFIYFLINNKYNLDSPETFSLKKLPVPNLLIKEKDTYTLKKKTSVVYVEPSDSKE